MQVSTSSTPLYGIFRWAARMFSLLVFLLVLVVALDNRGSEAGFVSIGEKIEICFVALAILGLLVAWKWEIAGAAVVLIGIIGNHVAFIVNRGYWNPGLLPPDLFLLVPAFLFVAYWKASRSD